MTLFKVKLVGAVVLAAAVVGSGAGVRWESDAAAGPTPPARPSEEPTVEELKRENERLRREVADLRKRLGEAEARTRLPGDDPPTDAEVLRAMPRTARAVPYVYQEFRDDITIVKTKILDRLDPPREYPKIGTARLRVQHWECAVYYTETVETAWPFPTQVKKPRVQVIYIDKNSLVPEPGGAK